MKESECVKGLRFLPGLFLSIRRFSPHYVLARHEAIPLYKQAIFMLNTCLVRLLRASQGRHERGNVRKTTALPINSIQPLTNPHKNISPTLLNIKKIVPTFAVLKISAPCWRSRDKTVITKKEKCLLFSN